MTFTEETIKKAVEALRENHAETYQSKLKASHAHEMLASYFGYASKAALQADKCFSLDPDEPERIIYPNATQSISVRLGHLKGIEAPIGYANEASKIIREVITPDCSICGCPGEMTTPAETDHNHTEQLWVCNYCIKKDEEVGQCRFCGENEIYPIAMLNSNGECPEHTGESTHSPEEQEGWDSYIEYLNKDN